MEISNFQAVKQSLAAVSNLTQDALHIYVGLLVFFSVSLLARVPLNSLWPLAMVALVAVGGELLDMRDDLNRLGYWRWRASALDIANTVFWPLAIWLLARLRLLHTSR